MTARAILELSTSDSQYFAQLSKAKKEALGLGDAFTQTGADAKAFNSALNAVFGTDLQKRAQNAVAAIQQVGGVTKLTDAEARKHLATMNEWIAKAEKLGKEVPADILKTRDALVRTNAEIGKTTSEIGKAPASVGSFMTSLKGVAAAAGIAFSVTAIKSWVTGTLEAAGQIDDLSKKLGVSATAVQEWDYAAKQSGTTIEAVEKAVNKMNVNLAEGDKSTVVALRQAGLGFKEIRAMKPEDAFDAITTAIGKIEDPMVRAKVAMQLFGKGGAEILPMIVDGSLEAAKGIKKMSDETVDRLAKAEDAWAEFKRKGTILSGELLGAMMKDAKESWDAWAYVINRIKGTPMPVAPRPLTPAQIAFDEAFAAKARAQAALNAKLASESVEAAEKAAKAAEQYGEKLAAVNAKIRDAKRDTGQLTDAQKLSIESYTKLGLSTSDIAIKLGLSELAIRKEVEAKKEDVKWTEKLNQMLEQQIPLLQRTRDALLALPRNVFNPDGGTVGDSIPLQQKSSLMSAAVPEWMRQPIQFTDQQRAQFAIESHKMMNSAELAIAAAKAGQKTGEGWVEAFIDRVKDGLPDLITSAAAAFGSGGLKGLGSWAINTARQFATDFAAEVGRILGPKVQAALSAGSNIAAGVGGAVGGSTGANIAGIAAGLGGAALAASSWGTAMAAAGVAGSIALGAATLGIGLAAIGVYKLITHTTEYEKRVREAAKQTAELRRQAIEIYGSAQNMGLAFSFVGIQIEEAFKSRDPKWIKTVLEEGGARLAAFNAGLMELATRATGAGPALDASMAPYIQRAREAGILTDELAAKLLGMTTGNKSSWQEMQSLAEKFGVELSTLGPTFQQQKLTGTASEIISAFDRLIGNGADYNGVLAGMTDEINEVVQNSQKFGTEIPGNMRPWIASLIESGRLLGVNEEKITDIDTLKFGPHIKSDVELLTEAIKELTRHLTQGVGGALAGLAQTRVPTIKIPWKYEQEGSSPSGAPGLPEYARGTGGYRDFGAGTPVMLHGWEKVVPLPAYEPGMLNPVNYISDAARIATTPLSMPAHAGTAASEGPRTINLSVDARGARIDTPERPRQLAKEIVKLIRGNDDGIGSDLFQHGQPVGSF